MNLLSVRGFVLGTRPLGEADRIVQFYTLQAGRVAAVARSARKPKSRVASALELFTEGSFSLHRKKGGGTLYVLGQARILDSHAGLKEGLGTIAGLQVMADILLQSLQEAEPHPELYDLVKGTLGSLEGEPGRPGIRLAAFVLGLLRVLGHPLGMEVCCACGGPLVPGGADLIAHRGGALCRDCGPGAPGRNRLPPAGLAALRKIGQLPLERVGVVKVPVVLERSILLAALGYLEDTVEKKLKAVEYYLEVGSKLEARGSK